METILDLIQKAVTEFETRTGNHAGKIKMGGKYLKRYQDACRAAKYYNDAVDPTLGGTRFQGREIVEVKEDIIECEE